MPITLTDEQAAQMRAYYEQAERNRAIAENAAAIWNDPQLSDDARALWKKKFPDARLEGYDTEQKVNARFDKYEQERADEKKRAEDEALQKRIDAGRQALRDKWKANDELIERTEKMMTERGIQNHEDAYELLASREPRPSSDDAGYSDHFWNHDQQDDFKAITSDPDKWLRGEIIGAVKADRRRQQR